MHFLQKMTDCLGMWACVRERESVCVSVGVCVCVCERVFVIVDILSFSTMSDQR